MPHIHRWLPTYRRVRDPQTPHESRTYHIHCFSASGCVYCTRADASNKIQYQLGSDFPCLFADRATQDA